jgi:hypothetical protein
VTNFFERAGWRGTDALGRRIRRLELWELLLEVLQLAQQPVVFGVAQLRRVLLVVQLVGAG